VNDPILIDHPDDPRVADYVSLTDAELRRKIEHGNGAFIAEGELVIRTLVASRYAVRSVLVTPALLARLADALATVDAPVYVAAPDVMAAVAGFDIHRGAVAAAQRPAPTDPASLLQTAGPLVVLDGLTDHENLGAVFRNAAAFGIAGALLSPTCADPLYRRSVRVSMGHVLRIPFARLTAWPDALDDLARAGWETVALTPHRAAEPIADLDPATSRMAVILGAEGPGLAPAVLDRCTRRVRIPMAPGVDSLNVATAAAIAFHHLAGLP
jgi:tRNA G18 (ribose-2'-O)-methylase SpoU